MKSVDSLLRKIRERTRNVSFTYDPVTGLYTEGMSTELFLDSLNDAQDHLQALLLDNDTSLFIQEDIIPIVAGTNAYTPTKKIFGNVDFISVHYNPNNNTTDFGGPMRKGNPRDVSGTTGYPSYWIPKNGQVCLYPTPNVSGGKLKVLYHFELDDLDIRRGKINATPSGAAIVLATSPVPDEYAITNGDYICVCNRWGEVLLRNGLVSSYNSGSRTIALAANVSTYLVSPYALADLSGAFVTVGSNTTTQSGLPDVCERYLRVFAQKRTLTEDESNTSAEEDLELKTIEASILMSYSDENRDVEDIPELDSDLML
jgi:hypothetical protein